MNDRSRPIDAAFRLIQLLALVIGCASAVLFWWQRGSLWEDEIIAVTHGLEPFPLFFVEVLRNDIHPIPYFLWVKLWSTPCIGSDSWLLASSLVGALASAAMVGYAAWRERGRDAALWAAGLFCLVPTFSWAAGTLRMYAFIPGVAVACWLANRDLLRNGGWRRAAALVALQLLQTYLHAIGFFFAAFIALAAFAEHRRVLDRSRLALWAASQVLSLAGMLPMVASALVRGTEPLPGASLLSLVLLPAHTLSDWRATGGAVFLGGLTFVFLAGYGLSDRLGRILVLFIPGGALLACILASLLGKPMFKPPVFTANLVPFLAIAAGFGLAERRSLFPRAVAAACMTVMAAALWAGTLDRGLAGNDRPAALYLTAHVHPGDLVVVPSLSVFWGMMRYAVGPRWGEPLSVMPRHGGAAWEKIKEKLGPDWCGRLGLTPRTDILDSDGVRYVIGTEIGDNLSGRHSLWVVNSLNFQERGQEDMVLPRRMRQESVSTFGDEFSVSHFVPVEDP